MLRHGSHKLARILLASLTLVMLITSDGCNSKKSRKVHRIGVLSGLDYISDASKGFRGKMAELGYMEGSNIIYDFQATNFEPDKEKQILKKFISEKVNLILTYPTKVSMTAKQMTRGTDIPVLFCLANIEDTNLVKSVSYPGENITGVRYPGPDITLKRFEIMLELVPHAKSIWVPYQRNYPIIDSQLRVLHKAAAKKGVTILESPADDAHEIQQILQQKELSDHIDMDAILFIVEPLTVTSDVFVVIGKFAFKHKIPLGGALISAQEYSSVFGVNVDIIKTGERAAISADKILSGTPAGTIPVISAESHFEINYTAAKKLGIEIPDGLLSKADRVIR